MIRPLEGKARRSVQLATARFNIWEGAVRSSKTVASTMCWMRYVRSGPAGNLAMIGKTERTLKRNVIDPIIEMVGTERCRYLVGAGELHLFGRRIYTAGANDARAVEKIQGLTLAGAYGDEIATWPEDFWDMLGTRLSVPGAQFFGTANPAGPVHWLKRNWLDRSALWVTRDGDTSTGQADPIDLHRFSFTLDDNPHLDPAFVAALKRQYVGLFYKRYIQGLWVLAEGAVYEAWDEARHVVDQLPDIARLPGLGIDYGTVNPFAALPLGIGEDKCLYLVDEWRWDSKARRQQLTDAEYSQRLRTWMGERKYTPEWIAVDPSAASFKLQLFRDGHSNVMDADNSVLDGIRLIASLLATDRLKVSRRCKGWIDEAPGYCWDDKAAEKGRDEPVKANDHSLDGGRYAVASTQMLWRPLVAGGLDLPA